MEYSIGFLIALAVGLTGVGAGSITAPVLMLFLGVAPLESVGTALVFAAVIKLAVFPVYLYRRQVHARVLMLLCAGGVPGVVAGFFLLNWLDVKRQPQVLYVLLGLTIAVLALYNLYRALRKTRRTEQRDRSAWLPLIAAGIGTEVGFSSAGAGALGSVALLSLTRLEPAQVVGTDLMFGLVLSLIGGGFHFSAGHYEGALLMKLITGGVAGCILGALLATRLPARPLRVALSVWLTFIGGQLCWKAFA